VLYLLRGTNRNGPRTGKSIRNLQSANIMSFPLDNIEKDAIVLPIFAQGMPPSAVSDGNGDEKRGMRGFFTQNEREDRSIRNCSRFHSVVAERARAFNRRISANRFLL
jgi:hypothetical protein